MRSRAAWLFRIGCATAVAACGSSGDGGGTGRGGAPAEGAMAGGPSSSARGAGGGPCTVAKAPPDVPFSDVTKDVGIAVTHHLTESFCTMPDVIAPGVCMIDYDGDGDVDLFFPDRAPHPARLFRNDGGTFIDASEAAGIDSHGDGIGCLAADYDGDGDLDLYLANAGPDALLRNDDGTFVDVTADVGLVENGLSASVTAGDMDGDGDLDFAVAKFTEPGNVEHCMPVPDYLPPLRNELYENRDGKLVEVALERGLDVVEPTLAIAFVDIDLDGDLDLYVGNDLGVKYPDRFYENDGTGHFVDRAEEWGLAWDQTGHSGDTMGVAFGDYDLDGTLDLVTSSFLGMRTLLYDCAPGPSCIENPLVGFDGTVAFLSWTVGLVDFDHDGQLDFHQANGTIWKGGAQRNQLYWNRFGHFEEYVPEPDEALGKVQNSRGAAYGDIDADGDVDIVVANGGEAPQVLRNDAATGSWLIVALDTRSAGALVTVEAEGRSRTQPVIVGAGYLGSSDPRVHFGLGQACEARVLVRWLDGTERDLGLVAANQVVTVERP